MTVQGDQNADDLSDARSAKGPGRAPGDIRTVSSADLLGAGGELIIEHTGHSYRLRITSKGKLILTK